jgi:hypothetical protein
VAARPLAAVQAMSTSAGAEVSGGQIAQGAALGFAVSACAGARGSCAVPMVGLLAVSTGGLAGNR